jgi:hypothetical protein
MPAAYFEKVTCTRIGDQPASPVPVRPHQPARRPLGGAIENRIRFPLAVVRAVADVVGANRLGPRTSPGVPNNDIYGGDHRGFTDYPALA